MRRLQIGMWHEFSEARWEQLADDHISGMEISCYANRAAVQRVSDFCRLHQVEYGIHGPVLGNSGYSLPLLNAPEPEVFHEALQQITSEVQLASLYGADYILFHYPFYPTFQAPFRPYPRLPDVERRYSNSQLSRGLFKERSQELFEHLSTLQLHYGQRIVLEHDFFGEYEDILIDQFHAFPDIQFVLDTARLDITRRAFPGFDPYAFLDQIAPHVYLVHYSNVFYEEHAFTHHLPVLALHEHDDNFGDSLAYLRYLATSNQAFHLTFEHQADRISRQELYQVYQQTATLLEERGGPVLNR